MFLVHPDPTCFTFKASSLKLTQPSFSNITQFNPNINSDCSHMKTLFLSFTHIYTCTHTCMQTYFCFPFVCVCVFCFFLSRQEVEVPFILTRLLLFLIRTISNTTCCLRWSKMTPFVRLRERGKPICLQKKLLWHFPSNLSPISTNCSSEFLVYQLNKDVF